MQGTSVFTPRLAGLLVAGALAGASCGSGTTSSSTSAGTAGDSIYNGLSGQQIVYEGAGNSGAFNDALTNSFIASFTKRTGVTVAFDSFCCGVDKLAGMEDSGNVTWDMASWSTVADFKEAEAQDLLAKLDPSIIPVDRMLPGYYDDYGIDMFPYAATVVWNTDAFPLSGKHPTTIEDVFDTKDFPGRRCLDKYPEFGGTLEAAALASGVSPDKLYPLDVNRALNELATIKGDTLFWTTSSQGVQALLTGSCTIGLMYNGASYDAIRSNPGAKLAVAYGHAIWDTGVFTIPKGTKHLAAAEAFLRWLINDTASQSKMLTQTSYLSVNLKTQPTIPANIVPYALAGNNLKMSIQEDDAWYGRNIKTVLAKFNAFLAS